MKIGFFADLHLGAGRDLGHGEYGAGSRFLDQERVLDKLGDHFIAEKCEVVCFVGDAVHHALAKPWEILALQFFFRRMTEAGIRVIIVQGNHDVKGAALPTILGVFRDDNVTLASTPRLIPVNDVVFACLPWTPLSTLVAAEGRTESLRDTATELLIRSMRQLREACAKEHPDALPILLPHWSISGASLPNGLPVDQLSEVVLPWLDIDALGWKLVAAGHIHKMQVIAEGVAATPMFYCSSAAVTSLGEIDGHHGCWIYDTEADELRFVPVEDRPFVDWEADAMLDPDGYSVLVRAGDGAARPSLIPDAGAVVRIRYRANGLPVDEADIRKAMTAMGAHKVFIKEIDRPTSSRSRLTEPIADDITPADALGLWLGANDVLASRNGDGPRFEQALRERHLAYIERLGAS